MKSLEERFNGNKEEVITYARNFGVLPAMEQFEVKSLDAMLRYLHKVSPEETFRMAKVETSDFSRPDAFDGLLKAVLRKYDEQNTKIATLVTENAELKKQVDYYKSGRWEEVNPVVQNLLHICEGDGI